MLYLFSFLWNIILVLIFNMVIFFICEGWPLKCTAWGRISFFIDQHPGNNCVLFIELFTNRHVKKKITTVSIFIPIVAIWLWDLRNNYLFYNLLQFLTFVLFITYILYKVSRSWTIGRDIFFSAEDYTNVVVLDQSTVTFQKGWGL